jgi:hypothetical protein
LRAAFQTAIASSIAAGYGASGGSTSYLQQVSLGDTLICANPSVV